METARGVLLPNRTSAVGHESSFETTCALLINANSTVS